MWDRCMSGALRPLGVLVAASLWLVACHGEAADAGGPGLWNLEWVADIASEDALQQEGQALDEAAEPNTWGGRGCADLEPREHVVDGAFTGWSPGSTGPHEWSCTQSVTGQYTHFYLDWVDGYLYILNDWHLNSDAPIGSSCYNEFTFTTDSGQTTWEMRVYGDQTVEVTRNGVRLTGDEVQGAAGFGYSPLTPDREHTIFEIAVPASEGDVGMLLKDPETSLESTCRNPGRGGMVSEPSFFRARLSTGKAAVYGAFTEEPALVAADPRVVAGGERLTLRGIRFGVLRGKVLFRGAELPVERWSDTTIQVVIPRDLTELSSRLPFGAMPLSWQSSGPVVIQGLGGDSNTIEVTICEPECDGRECGDDGCGGTCGECVGVQHACVEGECRCYPSCIDAECGDDGCGGSCGDCAGERAVCVAGHCACVPDCVGRDCGDDGCGSSCGECPAGQDCSKVGRCVVGG